MITGIITFINDISQGNQMIAGALALAFSGAVGWAVTQLPRKIIAFIKMQFVTTMTFNNTDYDKDKTFLKINQFLKSLSTESGSRTLILDSGWVNGKDVLVLGMGYGHHIFFYKKKLMWMSRNKLDSSGSEKQKEEISISTLGRSYAIFDKIVKANMPDNDDHLLKVSEYSDECWSVIAKCNKSGMSSLALDDEIKQQFTKEIDFFFKNKDLYLKLNLPYKLTMLLYGPPGSGKTSIIRALASDYKMNVCTLNLTGMTDKSFRNAILSCPAKSFILIEDFDSNAAVKKRKEFKPTATEEDGTVSYSMLTLSGILNTLDGIASLNGNIIVFTTNCINDIDPAITRSGRTDMIIELPVVSPAAIELYFKKMYDGISIDTYPALSAKDINAIVFECKDDVKKVEIKLKDFSK